MTKILYAPFTTDATDIVGGHSVETRNAIFKHNQLYTTPYTSISYDIDVNTYWTIAFLFYFKETSDSQLIHLCSLQGTDEIPRQQILYDPHSYKLFFITYSEYYDSHQYVTNVFTYPLKSNSWQHIAFSHNTNNTPGRFLWLNGKQLLCTTRNTFSSFSGTHFELGMPIHNLNENYIGIMGGIKELNIWSSAPNDCGTTDIPDLYNSYNLETNFFCAASSSIYNLYSYKPPIYGSCNLANTSSLNSIGTFVSRIDRMGIIQNYIDNYTAPEENPIEPTIDNPNYLKSQDIQPYFTREVIDV